MTDKRLPLRERLRDKFRTLDTSFMLSMISLFQILSFLPVVFSSEDASSVFYLMGGYILFEWVYVKFMHSVLKKTNFELEFIAFFLSGIGLCLNAAESYSAMFKQLITVIAGVLVYDILLWFLKDVKRVMKIRTLLAIFSVFFIIGSYFYIKVVVGPINGAYNWIYIGGISVQPSEFLKIAFIFVGGASLDKLLTSRHLWLYLLFSGVCIGVLFAMKDFGTALIFFFTFIVIAYMRSGSMRTVIFICAIALIGALLILFFLPHVTARFQAYRHIWDDPNGRGYQQTRVLIYAVSGGLQGIGIGNGELRNVYAATSDLVFGLICEELGILIAFAIVITIAFIAIYAVKSAKSAPSTFYSIVACSAAAMLLFQTSLNIFGITDILPLTGVTLPFVSQGGSSMISCWGLLALIKAADIRAYPKTYRI